MDEKRGLWVLGCWVVVGLLALAVAAPTGASAAVGARGRATVVVVSASGDRAATRALLNAEYGLLEATLARLRRTDAKLSGRVQGECARSEREGRTIEEEIDETIFVAADRVLRGPYGDYVAAVDGLSWSNPTIDALVHQRVAQLQEEIIGPPVAICAEMRAWAASGFHRLPTGSRLLEEAGEARDKRAVRGNLDTLLRKYEDRGARALARRIAASRERLAEQQRDDEVSMNAWYRLELALGEKPSRFAEQQVAPVIAKGRTHAGTTFVIRVGVREPRPSSCRRELEVEVRERRGGSGSGMCLSERAHPHASSNCSGSVETVQLATPPDVRGARVRLSDGRTVSDEIVQVPVRDGGPAGVFIDAFRGYHPYPVSVQELSRDGRVLRTVGLRDVHCTPRPADGAPGPPQVVKLAAVTTPSGEPLTISGTLLHFGNGHTEFSLGPEIAMRNSELSEEDEDAKSKQFQWNLSTECAPHPYSLLDGILAAPGASVLVRTPAGLTPLTKVELAASMDAGGPLFYGVYTTPPTEIVVENAEGSTIYTESLSAKATEETEFCEGYAEQ